jgi:DNA-directed RNA polymerase subunit RPC12/RpoP
MAAWVLACVNCKFKFLHSKIGELRLLDFLDPAKPDMPEGGVELECPNCGHRGVYRRTDLTYARSA